MLNDKTKKMNTENIKAKRQPVLNKDKDVNPASPSKNFDKEKLTLDQYQDIYDRDIKPIINDSLVQEFTVEFKFINRFSYRYPDIKELTIGNEKYSFYEILYLFYIKNLLAKEHLLRTVKTESLKRALSEQEITDLKEYEKKYSLLNRVLVLYMKRVLILDRLLTTCKYLEKYSSILVVERKKLYDEIEKKEFYINHIFYPESSLNDLLSEFTFIINKVNIKYYTYQVTLSLITSNIMSNVSNNNSMCLKNLFMTMCEPSKILKSSDLDFFKFFLLHYTFNGNFDNLNQLKDYQKKQLMSYYREIYSILTFMLMGGLTTNQSLLVSMTKFEFIPISRIVNHPISSFISGADCSNALFSNIIKMHNLISIHLANYFYNSSLHDPQIYIGTFILEDLMSKLNKQDNK